MQRGRADGIQKIISPTNKNTTVHVLTHSGIFYLYCIFALQVIPRVYRATAREPMGSQGSKAMGSALYMAVPPAMTSGERPVRSEA